MKNPLLVVSLVLLLCFAFGCQNRAEKAELEKTKAMAKTEAQNKEIVRDFFAAIDKGNLDRVKELIAGDFALHAPGLAEPWGADNLIQDIKTFYAAFPDNIHMIDDIIAEDDKIAVRLTTSGSHKEAYAAIPATGKKVTNSGMHMMVIADGKIKRFWALEDSLGFMTQLGMELRPKEAEKK